MTGIDATKYRIRLRVRFNISFSSDETRISTSFAGRELSVLSQKKGQRLSEAKWLIIASGGFTDEESAWQFGKHLSYSLQVAGLCSRLGVDIGDDKPTSHVSEEFARSIGIIGSDDRLFPNYHGLVVIPDDGRNRFPLFEATGTIRHNPSLFFDTLAEVLDNGALKSSATANGLFLLNAALMSIHPLAQAVLALSAIEAIGQDEKWSESQQLLIGCLVSYAEENSDFEAEERKEVANAIRRGLLRVSVRQGVLRVLKNVGINHLKSDWDKMYQRRSRIFHGADLISDPESSKLAEDSIEPCGKILLRMLQNEGTTLPAVAFANFGEI